MTSFSTPKTGPLTKEYEAGHVANFGAKKDQFCKCGYLPAWCKCAIDKLDSFPDLKPLAARIKAARGIK
jgi:hypothetical protein